LKTAIVGSRSLSENCYSSLERYVPKGTSEIISGGAEGIDSLAERYAQEHGLAMTVIRPDYKLYDRHAPLIRNSEICNSADYVLILWDGISRGSMNVIMTCIKQNKPFRVLLVEEKF